VVDIEYINKRLGYLIFLQHLKVFSLSGLISIVFLGIKCLTKYAI